MLRDLSIWWQMSGHETARERLKALRQYKGISREDVARGLDISLRTVYRHEDGTTPNGALAVDMVGDLTVLRTDGYKFGLIEFADVNNEPWHAQPLELPHARREFDLPTMYPLHAWQFPLTPAPPPEGEHMELAVLTLNNTQPKTTFLGYVNLKPTPGGGVNPQFWDVLWIDGADPAAVKMLEDQINFGGAKTYEFGEHVAKSLWLLNEDLPTSLLSDGRPWSVSDWGRVGSKAA